MRSCSNIEKGIAGKVYVGGGEGNSENRLAQGYLAKPEAGKGAFVFLTLKSLPWFCLVDCFERKNCST